MRATLNIVAATPDLHLPAASADRVFDILKENNPELTGEKRRTIMKPPQVWTIAQLLMYECLSS